MRTGWVVVLIAVLILSCSAAYAVVGANPPPAPSNVRTADVTVDSISYAWSQVGQADGYHVFAGVGSVPSTPNATLAPKQTTSWTFGSLAPNTEYAFQMDAYNQAGTSALTAVMRVYTLQLAPATPAIAGAGKDWIALGTSGPVNLNAGNSGVVFNVNGSDRVKIKNLSENVGGLAPNTQYTFKAKASNAAGNETGYSGMVSKYTLAGDPVFGSSGAGAINGNKANGATVMIGEALRFSAVNGFGAGADKASKYRYVWSDSDTSPVDWASSLLWGANDLEITPAEAGSYFLHLQALNAEDEANPTTLTLGYVVIPEPSGVLALTCGALGLIGMARRRK